MKIDALAAGELVAAWMRASDPSVIWPEKVTLFWTKRSAPPLVTPKPFSVKGSASKYTDLPPPCASSVAPFATTVPEPTVPKALVWRICKAPSATVSTLENELLPVSTIRPAPRLVAVFVPEIVPPRVKSTPEALVQF